MGTESGKKYEQVREFLLNRLRHDGYEPGDFVGAEQGLVDELGVSRNTVRHAIGTLVTEGILYRKRGKGIFFAGFDRPHEQSGIVGVITHTLTDNIYPAILQGIEDVVHERGYSLALSSTSFDSAKELDVLDNLVNRGIEGLIIEPAFSSELTSESPIVVRLRALSVPVVLTNCHFPFLPCSAVTIDDVGLGRRAAEFLIQKGHRRIAYVYYRNALAATERLEGITEVLGAARADAHQLVTVPYETGEELHPAYSVAQSFLSSKAAHDIDAVVFYNDQTAIDAYPAFHEAGLKIGTDISILAFDDIPLSRSVTPPLTTFIHPKYDMGRWAASLLFEELTQEPARRIPRTVNAHPPLIERASVRSIPAAR